MWLKNKFGAFTLLECLVALMVISGSVLLFQGLGQVLRQEMRQLSESPREEWLLFAEQFRYELIRSQLLKVTPQKLYVKQDGKALAFGYAKGEFRKTSAEGRGYQPMLSNLEAIDFKENDGVMTLVVTFKDGREKQFDYAFEK